MALYDAKATDANGITMAQEVLTINEKTNDPGDYVRTWARKSGAVGWSMIGPLGTADQAFRSGLVK